MDNSEVQTPDPELRPQSDEIDTTTDQEVSEGLVPKMARFLRLCWFKRKTVFTILAIGISISLAIALLEKNVYTSTTTFMPPDSMSASSNLLGMMASSSAATSIGSQMLGLETPGELYVSILQSRNVLDGLISRFALANYYQAHMMIDARKSLARDTQVSIDRKSGVISVSVTVTNPGLAANIARGYVTELNRVLTEASTSSARSERIFLEGRVKEVKQQLDDYSKALSQFSTKSGTIDMPNQARSMVDAGLRLQTELITGRSQLAGLLQTYAPDNPRVRAVQARNAELQRQIDALGGKNQPPASDNDLQKGGYPSAGELPTLGLTYYDLQRKVQVQEALWEALTRQLETARVQEAEQTPAARILDVADVPERKSGPSRRLALMIGTVLSLLVACISVIAMSIWDGLGPQDEPKKLILEIADGVMDRRRWYWSLPGIRSIHHRIIEERPDYESSRK
jgi:uncharacterized protein involved in exopolysaccharide biosynthesis